MECGADLVLGGKRGLMADKGPYRGRRSGAERWRGGGRTGGPDREGSVQFENRGDLRLYVWQGDCDFEKDNSGA